MPAVWKVSSLAGIIFRLLGFYCIYVDRVGNVGSYFLIIHQPLFKVKFLFMFNIVDVKYFFRIMSKRTKLETLNCTKKLRSSSQLKINNDEETVNAEPTGTVSKYFNAKIVEPKKKSNHRKKKSVEIKYENNDKNENHNEKNGDEQEKWYPKNWEETLNFIREMRKNSTAPVDEMGCHKCSDTNATPPIFRYQSLVALMLSSQTKDQTNHAAMERLKAHGCTPNNIIDTSDEIFGKLIYPVSFWKVNSS